jgi:hypothetical protein
MAGNLDCNLPKPTSGGVTVNKFMISISAAISIIVLNSKAAEPKIWWSFENIKNKTVNNQNSEYSAPLKTRNTKLVPGHKGKCIQFKGSQSCAWSSKLVDQMNLAGRNPFTISFWFNSEIIKRHKKHELLNKGKDRGPGWRLYLSYGMLNLRIGGKNNKSGPSAILHTNENKVKFVPGKWYHVAIVRSQDGFITIFINGIEQVKSKKALSAHPSKIAFSIGNMLGRYYQYQGLLDEFKYYESALKPMAILKEANSENMMFEDE